MRKLLFVLLAFAPSPAFGWGCDGHQIVAMIARAHLTPAVSAAVDKLLSADPISMAHNRYCQDTPTDLMAVAAPWADDVKSATKTGEWHYIDIPLAVETRADYHKWCEPIGPAADGKDRTGCIVTAIDYEWAILRDAAKPTPERAAALRYLIHFLGDLTQPLHDTDNHDQGGNCTSFRLPFADRPVNLHSIWDSELLTHELKERKLTEVELAAMLDEQFADQGKQWIGAKTDAEAWAWETHKLAATFAYGLLNPAIPVAPADAGLADKAACDLGKQTVADMNIPIQQNYMDLALNTIHQQIARAGYRLAGLLNETLQ
jgi:hypothetical protein